MVRLMSNAEARLGGSTETSSLRRSPRKRATEATASSRLVETKHVVGSKKKGLNLRSESTQGMSNVLREISLPSTEDEREFETAITSAQRARPSSKLTALDSITTSLSKMAVSEETTESADISNDEKPSTKSKAAAHYTSRFVLKEADCIDDYSDYDEDDDEVTDLSGFIVDDNAEVSYHISSGEDSEEETPEKKRPQRQTRRRLQRGHRRVVDSDDSDKENGENGDNDPSSGAIGSVSTNDSGPAVSSSNIPEIIDLTSSPEASPLRPSREQHRMINDPFAGGDADLSKSLKGLSLFESMMRLSPPRKDSSRVSEFEMNHDITNSDQHSPPPERPQTPTRSETAPRLTSPSKLLSPSKRTTTQRSPHRQSTDAFWDHHSVNDWNDTHSPKKAPLDSPAKNPLSRFAIWSDPAPSSASDDNTPTHSPPSSPLPSPCASPTKPRSTSPSSKSKSPSKTAIRAAALAEKRTLAARKAAFNSTKDTLATNLLTYLDEHVTSSQLSRLSASTGGVQIKWSKTLRSTAGRANWRRSVTRAQTGSPIKGSPVKGRGLAAGEGEGVAVVVQAGGEKVKVKVEHFASIELAEKVIDCEERLVNTLAHEFCHLANFMVSGVRDQPHGASFRMWAERATGCLASAAAGKGGGSEDERVRETWAQCKVTTKHSYEIEWKYLWGCVGREQSEAMKYLNVHGNEGCGAEYGRHSKSIDVERMRCGRCKGRLVQVRPTPRGVGKKALAKDGGEKLGAVLRKERAKRGGGRASGSGSGSESARSSGGGVEGLMEKLKLKEVEVVELSD